MSDQGFFFRYFFPLYALLLYIIMCAWDELQNSILSIRECIAEGHSLIIEIFLTEEQFGFMKDIWVGLFTVRHVRFDNGL